MSESSSEEIQRNGNTKHSAKKQISPAIRWCFTLNNYTKKDIKQIQDTLVPLTKVCVIGKEVGESGTPHLQGYIEFEKKMRPKSIGLNDGIHWEKAKGNKNQAATYCTKDDDMLVCKGFKKPKTEKEILEELDLFEYDKLYDWQKRIVDNMDTKPDKRKITWIYDTKGNVGKTELSRYLAYHKKSVVLSGKGADILHCALTYYQECEERPKYDSFVFCYSRSVENYISYESIEKLKDGCFYSGKYEGGTVLQPRPHIVVFANFAPDKSKLSEDRWDIRCLDRVT